jgi:hypothetical protein
MAVPGMLVRDVMIELRNVFYQHAITPLLNQTTVMIKAVSPD